MSIGGPHEVLPPHGAWTLVGGRASSRGGDLPLGGARAKTTDQRKEPRCRTTPAPGPRPAVRLGIGRARGRGRRTPDPRAGPAGLRHGVPGPGCADGRRRHACASVAQLQAHRAIAEPFALRAIAEAQEVIAAARAPIAQLQAQLELPAAAPTHATPPAVPSPPPSPAPPDSREAVAHAVAARIKPKDYDSIHALAQEFAPRFVMLGLLRRDSRNPSARDNPIAAMTPTMRRGTQPDSDRHERGQTKRQNRLIRPGSRAPDRTYGI